MAGVLIGAVVANLWNGAPLPVALGIGAGNTLEAVVATIALRQLRWFDPSLRRIKDVVALIVLGGLASTTVSATIGVASLFWGGLTSRAELVGTWRVWWVGDMLGDLVVAPLLLVWTSGTRPRTSRRRILEGAALGVSVVAMSAVVFLHGGTSSAFEQPFALFPLLIWAAIRFAQRGAVTTMLVVSAIAIWGTVTHHGPFARQGVLEDLFFLQVFTAFAAVTVLVLGALSAERRQAERERGAVLGALEEAVRARDVFISIASHELRTPLNAIKLETQVISRLATQADAAVPVARLRPKMDIMDRQVTRLANLIDQLLDVSRITVGRLRLDREEFDLSALVQEVLARSALDFERTGSALKVQVDAPVIGTWDRVRLDQVITNLLSNALKYGAGKPIRVSLGIEQDEAVLEVLDHGIGIDPEDQSRLFGRFERLVSERHFGGLGLGLWIVRQIVEELGGRVTVTSAPGEGAAFVVRLPLRPSEPAVAEAT